MSVNIQYLRDCLTAGENAPPELFDMRDWAHVTECGTAACLAGHYVLAYPGRGLVVVMLQKYGDIYIHAEGYVGPGGATLNLLAEHFGITNAESRYFFDSDLVKPLSRDKALGRLRDFISKKEKTNGAG